MKTKIQIKTVWGSVLFEHQADNNTTKKTVVSAVNTGADLTGADLRGAHLTGADLRGADLRGADLRGADLTGADLRGAYLRGANLTDADLRKVQAINQIIPEEGAFIAYKKGYNDDGNCLVKLEIPEKAKRHNSLGGRKCRAEFVKVLDIRNSKGHKVKSCYGGHNSEFIYTMGELATPDSYDPDPLKECGNGIHFFISKQEAKDW